MQIAHPELAHGYIDVLLVEQCIFRNLQRNAGRLGVSIETLPMQKVCRHPVMILCEHVGQRTPEIPEKTIADLRTLDYAAGEDRQIRGWIVTAALLKFRDHIVGPV